MVIVGALALVLAASRLVEGCLVEGFRVKLTSAQQREVRPCPLAKQSPGPAGAAFGDILALRTGHSLWWFDSDSHTP
eukprot:4091229-Amphidinium_carterae.1